MNPVTYEQSVDKLAETKKDLRNKWPLIKTLFRIFEAVFQRDQKEFFTVADMRFWSQQDQTSPVKKEKLKKFLDRFAILVHYYHFLGDNEIKTYLATKGIEISSDGHQLYDLPIAAGTIDPLDWDDAVGEKQTKIPDRPLEILQLLLDRSDEIFKDVNQLKDNFNEELEQTSQTEDLRKGHISKAASVRYKQLLNKPVDGDLAKVRKDAASAEQSISIFE